MKCEKAMDRIISMERLGTVPLRVRFHLFFCESCRSDFLALEEKLLELQEGSAYEIPADITDAVMAGIETCGDYSSEQQAYFKWIATGLLLLSGSFILSFSDNLKWLTSHFGGSIEVPLYIMLGVAITAYAAMFVGSHIGALKRLAEMFKKW